MLKKTVVQFAGSHDSGQIFKSADFSGQTKGQIQYIQQNDVILSSFLKIS